MACAHAGAFLISPFVGRITDWHAKAEGKTFSAEEDPGVRSVRDIYTAFKSEGIKTVVMGASFRNVDQIRALAGCDRLTISPTLLTELADSNALLERKLSPGLERPSAKKTETDEYTFRREMNEDAMATEMLAQGIRQFGGALTSLHELIRKRN